MADDSPTDFTSLTEALNSRIASQDAVAQRYEKLLADYKALSQRLTTLPDETNYDVQVPFGPLAFFPGKLIHTNEIMVLLGDNWFVERSSKQANAIVDRRMEYVQEKLDQLQQEKELLIGRKTVAAELDHMRASRVNEEGEPIVEIMEEVQEEEPSTVHTTQAESRPVVSEVKERAPEEFDAREREILERLRQMELEEEMRESDSDDDDDDNLDDYMVNDQSQSQQSILETTLPTDANVEKEVIESLKVQKPGKVPSISTPQGSARALRSSLKSPHTPSPTRKKSVSFDETRNQVIESAPRPTSAILDKINSGENPLLNQMNKTRSRIVMLSPGERSPSDQLTTPTEVATTQPEANPVTSVEEEQHTRSRGPAPVKDFIVEKRPVVDLSSQDTSHIVGTAPQAGPSSDATLSESNTMPTKPKKISKFKAARMAAGDEQSG